MAVTVRKHPKSPFWQAVVKMEDGKRTNRSTKIRVSDPKSKQLAKDRALEIQVDLLGDGSI